MSSSSKQAPQLKPRPDLSGDMSRLAALQSWSEQPAAGAAAVIGMVSEEVRVEPPPEHEQPAPMPAPVRGKRATSEPEFPWIGAAGNMQYSLTMPTELHIQMNWLAQTTYGDNTKQFVIRAIRAAVEAEFKKRGIKP